MTGTERAREPLSVTVRAVRAQNAGSEVAVSVMLCAGERTETRTLILTTACYCRLKPQKGPITEEEYDALEAASRLCMAVRCGENLLAYGANSRQMLIRKIMRHGFTRGEAEQAAETIAQTGLLNEEEDLRREVEKCLRKLWGEGRIRNQLLAKGFDRERICELLPVLLSEVDFAGNCGQLIRKQYGGLPDTGDEERRMIAGLYRYGYRMDEIREAVRALRRETSVD